MSELKELSPLIITLVLAALVILFRREFRKLVDWVVSFRQITKTKEGYSLVGSTDPERNLSEQPTKTNVATVSIVPPVTSTTTSTGATTATNEEPTDLNWIQALTDRRFDDALRVLQEEYDRAPDSDERLRIRAFMAHAKFEREISEGVSEFENLVSAHPTKAIVYTWYGLSYFWKHLPEKAIAVLNRGAEASEKKAALLDLLSDAYVQAGEDDKAIEAATRGTNADPSYWDNHLDIATIYARKKELIAAREWYLKALSASDNHERVLVAYAGFLADNKLTEEAILRYQQLVSLFPKNARYHTLLGNAYLTAELSDCALNEYIEADNLADPKEGWILANIGNVYNNKGLHSMAIEYLKKALTIEPDSQYAHERLGGAMKKRDEERKKLNETLTTARKSLTPTRPGDEGQAAASNQT